MSAESLFDDRGQPTPQARRTAAEHRKAEGMSRVAADVAWQAHARLVLRDYLLTHPVFFVDEFRDRTQLDAPREWRALGPVILAAARAGWIVKTGQYRPSVASNLTAKPVWRSTIYRRPT